MPRLTIEDATLYRLDESTRSWCDECMRWSAVTALFVVVTDDVTCVGPLRYCHECGGAWAVDPVR